MASIGIRLPLNRSIFRANFPRLLSSKASSEGSGPDTKKSSPRKEAETPKKVETPKPAKQEPFDNSQYRSQEYYQYNDMSFYDIDNDMMPFRLPQQSKFN